MLKSILITAFIIISTAAALAESKQIPVQDNRGKPLGYIFESDDQKSLMLNSPDQPEFALASCGIKTIKMVSSPQKTFTAKVIEKNCGASTDFATQVVIQYQNNEKIVAIYQGRPKVQPIWNSEKSLVIERSALETNEIFKLDPVAFEIKIAEKDRFPRQGATDKKVNNEASFNFGTTLAQTSSDEMILRVAGWAQEASGLYKSSWGRWDAPKNYGDNPEELAQVLLGIRYAKAIEPFLAKTWTRQDCSAECDKQTQTGDLKKFMSKENCEKTMCSKVPK